MTISGVDKNTKKKVRGAVFDNNNVSSDNSNALEVSSITVDKSSSSIDNSIVAFKRQKNNLQLNDNTANIIDATINNKKNGTENIAVGGDNQGGIDVPVISSFNQNSEDRIIAIKELGLNAL